SFSCVLAPCAVRSAIKEIPRAHLAFGPIIDRCFDRLDSFEAAGALGVGHRPLGLAADATHLGERRQERGCFDRWIVPGWALVHAARRALAGAARNIATGWASGRISPAWCRNSPLPVG